MQNQNNNLDPSSFLKAMIFWFSFLFILLWMTSCRAKKPAVESVKTSDFQKEQITTITTNQPIQDKIFIPVPTVRTHDAQCDSICQLEVIRALKNIQTSKQSGNNDYGFYFDNYKNRLIGYVNVGSTTDKSFSSNISDHKTNDTTTTIYESYVPLWVKILAYFGVFAILYFLFKTRNFLYKNILKII